MGSSEGQTYCLRWNNHKSNLVEILDALIKMESYVDCTIVVDDQVQFKAHRVVLAANSPYFQSILQDVPMDHCSILFPGVQAFEMRALLEYMYTGEVNVTQSQIPKIMKIAEQLEVKGLFDMTDLKAKFNKFDENTTTTASTSTSTTSSTTTNHHHHHYSSSQHQLPSTHNTTASSSSIFSSGNNNTEQNNSSSSSGRRNDDNRQTHSNIIGGGNSDLQHNQQSIDLPLSHHHHHQQQQSSPVITTSTNIATAAQSSSSSPPYTTYKSPYSSLYTKSPGPSTSDRQHWPSISPSSVIPSVSIPTTAAAAAMLSSVYESAADMNPLKRKKLSSISSMLMSRDTPILRNVLAQTHAADSSQPMPLVCQSLKQERTSEKTTPSVGGASDYSNNERQKYKHDEPHSPYTDKSFEDDGLDEPKYLGDSRSFSQQSNSQKPEWKRYKQYTRSDILAAIECVRNGMSALQASRKFGVPSRTLYDKVKKLGITTGRPMNRTIKRSPSSGSSPASFPFGLSGTSNPYGQSSTDAILSQIHHESNEHHHHHHHHHHRDKDRGEHHIPSNIPHPAAAALLDPAFLQQAFESRGGDIAGREALHAMALAAAAHAAVNGISTSPGTNGTARSPSPGFAMKYSRSQSTPPPPSQLTRERDRDFMDREIEHEQRDRERERENDMDEEFDRSEREHDRDHEMDHDTEEDENHVEDLSVSRKDTQSPADQISPRPPSNHHSYGPVQQSSGGVIVPPMTKLSPNGGEDFKINIEHKREILTDDARENN